MSLSERVNAASGGRKSMGSGGRYQLERRLRERVGESISSAELSAMMRDNPQRARNEVLSVCSRVFAEPQWESCDNALRTQLASDLLDSIFGFGLIQSLIDNPDVTEIMVNGRGPVFVEREGRIEQACVFFEDDEQIRSLIDRIIAPLGRRIDESCPMVDARLPQGHRVNAVIPPVSLDGPVLTIRKFSEQVMGLSEMLALGSIDELLMEVLSWAVRTRCNVAVSGGTGSGKTTMLNALSREIPPEERVITIEDSAELRFLAHPHVIRLEARPANAEGIGQVTIRQLVANSLRMRPDRIVVGEVRGAEALDMLQAMNTGHDGSLTTLHANSPEDMVSRLATMVRFGADLPIDVIEGDIASALDLVVQVRRSSDGRRYVCALAELARGGDGAPCAVSLLYERPHPDDQGVWLLTPGFLDRAASRHQIGDEEVQAWARKAFSPSAA